MRTRKGATQLSAIALCALTVALAGPGCSLLVDFDETLIGGDGAVRPDSGMMMTDSGPPGMDAGRDAGPMDVDAGEVDAGPPDVDAGDVDAGPAPMDAGPMDVDAGELDAGPPPVDAGDVDAGDVDAGVDAGPPDMDAGDVDAGEPTDAGVDAGCSGAGDCDDGNGCTVDTCPAGACVHTASTCDDTNTCTTDSCMSTGAATFTCNNAPVTVGTLCSDGLFCTTGDACNAGGMCTGAAMSCTDADPCTVDSCVEAIDMCRSQLVTDVIGAVGYEVLGTDDAVRLTNTTTVALDVGAYFVCTMSGCYDIPAGSSIPAMSTLVVRGGTGTDTVTTLFSGGDLGVMLAMGEAILRTAAPSGSICDYVQWGVGSQSNAATAVAAGRWSAATAFVDTSTTTTGQAILWTAGTDNNAPARWTSGAF